MFEKRERERAHRRHDGAGDIELIGKRSQDGATDLMDAFVRAVRKEIEKAP
jgi:hypothetical protein